MKILMINVVCGIRSTGRICTDIAAALEEQGHEVKIAFGRETVPEQFRKYAIRIGSELDVSLHGARARLFDEAGWGSKAATAQFLHWVTDYNPDVIHLHNLHGYYINLPILFDYLKTCGKRVIWTLHDCWAFTGHAAYCEAANCERWRTGCFSCPKKTDYPKSLTDFSRRNWNRKQELLRKIPNLELVVPSCWLAGLVRQSFLSEYPVRVIHNGVDTRIFRKTDSVSIRKKLEVGDKKVILGVAAVWDERKGLRDFARLQERLDPDCRIVLVGLTEEQIAALPEGMTGLGKTNSVEELVELYNLAHVFVNPTYEDNYPTTNLEAIACGTPVITYKTGGSGESAALFGTVLSKGDVEGIADAIRRKYDKKVCPACFDSDIDNTTAVQSYLQIYRAEMYDDLR